jgi:hypothetical protein
MRSAECGVTSRPIPFPGFLVCFVRFVVWVSNRTTKARSEADSIRVPCSRDFACVGGFPITRSCGDTSQNRERYLDFGFRISDFGFRISTRSGGGASQNRERSWNAGILPACVNRIERLGSSNAECGVRNAELHPDQSKCSWCVSCISWFGFQTELRLNAIQFVCFVRVISCVLVVSKNSHYLTRTKHQVETRIKPTRG